MNMFRHTTILPALAAFAAVGAVATLQGTTDLNPAATGDKPAQPGLQTPTNQSLETMDQPQGLPLAEERIVQLRNELTAAERTIAQLRDRLTHSVKSVEQIALRQKLSEQEAIQHRLEKELHQQEHDLERLNTLP